MPATVGEYIMEILRRLDAVESRLAQVEQELQDLRAVADRRAPVTRRANA